MIRDSPFSENPYLVVMSAVSGADIVTISEGTMSFTLVIMSAYTRDGMLAEVPTVGDFSVFFTGEDGTQRAGDIITSAESMDPILR